MAKVPTKFQLSAGGVVFRRTGEGEIEVALIATTAPDGSRRWALPKGLVERGEAMPAAALREVQEETGLTGRVLDQVDMVEYWYRWQEAEGPVRYHKKVYFYLIEATGGDVADHDWEVEAARWFPLEEAIAIAAYEGEQRVLRKAAEMLRQA
ncbi:MAG: NUDIX domain-containing protein [Anaerolineae bacterium]|nr:NUDIX domain-containing protein [Anaerolineae bacterium]